MSMQIEIAEVALLVAVRDHLRTHCGYSEAQCEIELDETTPATVGDTYVIVQPAGFVPGPLHNQSGTVADLKYSVEVTVIKRAGHVPKDRKRNIFLENATGFGAEFAKVFSALDWRYEVLTAANAIILAESGSTEHFSEPLRLERMDRKPRAASPEIFSAHGSKPAAGLMRMIGFGGARRVTVKQR